MTRPVSVDVTNNTLSLDDFEKLTVGRKHNLGTLKVVKNHDRIIGLKCVNHHESSFFRKENVTVETAQTLRNAFEEAVNKELDYITGKLLVGALDTAAYEQMDKKIYRIKSALAEQMSIGDPQSRSFTPLPRAKMGEIISQIKALKELLKDFNAESGDDLDIVMCKVINGTKFSPGELAKLDKSVFDRVSVNDISQLANKIKPLTAGCVKRFADMVDKFADILTKKAGNSKEMESVKRFVKGDLSPENIRRAAVKSCLRMKDTELAMLKEAKELTPDDFKRLISHQRGRMEDNWQSAKNSRGTFDNFEHGMYWEFLRCQSSVDYYKQFSFNGAPAPKGKEGEEFDSSREACQTNAGLQREMREMIPDPTMRVFVTTMCGLQGFSVLPSCNDEMRKMDFGHGSINTLELTGCLGSTGCDRSGTRRFDLSVENGDLIFTQKVNFVHPFAHFPGVKDLNTRLDLNDNEQFTVSRNVLELKMRIPLNQVVELGKMPEVHIMSITQTIEDQEPNVYTPQEN